MATFQCEFFSVAMKRMVQFQMVLPNDVPPFMTMGNPNYERPTGLMILLHGYNGTYTDWMYGSSVGELAGKYNLAFVMPAAENSFYLNDDRGFTNVCTYVGEELVAYVRRTFGLSTDRENTFIGGYSMGGFGAIHTAAAYPETFGKVIALSTAYILENIADITPDFKDPMCDYNGYVRIFGDLSKLLASDSNPEVLLRRIKAEGGRLPSFYLACGLEDFLLRENRKLAAFMKEEGIPFEYHEGHGIHNWAFWNTWFEPGLQWMLEQESGAAADTEHVMRDTNQE